MATTYVPPFMRGLFTPVIPVRQRNSGSVRKWLFRSPEEALREGMWDLPLCNRNWKLKMYFYFCLSCSFLRMVIKMHRSLGNESSSLSAFSLPGLQMRQREKTYKAKSYKPSKQLERIGHSQAMILV